MQRRPRLRIAQRHPEHGLDHPQPLIKRGPGHVRPRRRQRLVPPGLKKRRQIADQPRPVQSVIRHQRPQLPVRERTHPRVVPQLVQQPSQPLIRQLRPRLEDPRVHRLRDLHERDLAPELDQHHSSGSRRRHQRRGQRPRIPPPQLDRQPGDPRQREFAHVSSHPRRRRRQRDPGRQHQLPAPQ